MAQALARVLGSSLLVRGARRAACYLSNDGEIDPRPAIRLLRRGGTRMWLPSLHGESLWFLPFDADTPLALNRFGIPEPDVPASRRCPARHLDLVLCLLYTSDAADE